MVGAFVTNSLALLSDAAHMGTDTMTLVIALVAVWISRRPPDAKRTLGYVRMEALGAMVNGLMLFAVAGYILWEAVGRFRQPPEVASTGMLVIAVVGLVVNLSQCGCSRRRPAKVSTPRAPTSKCGVTCSARSQ
jgi:cobalt-zinc-cadmium efflux system protein